MTTAHKICPICRGEFEIKHHFNEPCREIDRLNFTFMSSYCGGSNDQPLIHIFHQISAFDQLFYYVAQFYLPEGKFANFEVNYVLWKTAITYLAAEDADDETILIPQKLLEVDFPKCAKTIRKIRAYAPLL